MYSSEVSQIICLKRKLFKHGDEIIKDLQLEEAICCPDCIIGNIDSGCYEYCSGCCRCDHNKCENCDMTCHHCDGNNEFNECKCNCDHSKCNRINDDDDDFCNGTCHEDCENLGYIGGDKKVVSMILKEALHIDGKIFEKYKNLLDPDDTYFQKPYEVTLMEYYD